MAPPGPFTSAALFVGALFGTPFVIDQFKNPTGQDRIAAAVDSLKAKVYAPPAAAVIKEEAVPVVEPKATTPAPPAVEATTPAPTVTTPQKATTTQAPSDKQWSTATPGEVESEPDAGANSKTPPKAEQSSEPKQPAPSAKADAKHGFKEVFVQHLEVNAIAFDKFCAGPWLRERLSVHLKDLGILSHLEKFQAHAGSVAERVGLSSVAASAIMSLALIADFGLIVLFVLWRLWKCVAGSGQQKIDEIKSKVGENGSAPSPKRGAAPKGSPRSPKGGPEGSPKSPAPRSATLEPPGSGSRKNKKQGK